MNATRWLTAALFCALVLTVLGARASGTLGVYGIVEKVVFEPNPGAPERVRVYGAFTLYDRTHAIQAAETGAARSSAAPPTSGVERGYLYFTLPYPDTKQAGARREWADLAAVAGTGEAVAFASYGFFGAFSEARARAAAEVLVAIPPSEYPPQVREMQERMGGNLNFAGSAIVQVWAESANDSAPIRYATAEVGVVRLGKGNHADIIAKLRAALDRPR